MTLQPQKLNELFLFSTVYSRLGNGVPMVTKLVLKIYALCNKNDVTLLTMDLPICDFINFEA